MSQHQQSRLVDDLDVVTAEIISGKLLALVDEMAIIMAKTSMSPVIYEVLDFACGICTSQGELVAQSNGITLFTGTFGSQVAAVAKQYEGDIAPGDIFITNDPFNGGTHSCDMAVIRPIFHGDRIIAYAITVAHWLDVGGAVPGSLPTNANSCFQEGLSLSLIRIGRNGELLPDMVRIIEQNVRLPDMAIGDLMAQLATTRVAENGVRETLDKYGLEAVENVFTHIITSGEKKSRAVITDLPDGEYFATEVIDGDGIVDTAIPVQVKITIRNDEMIADFTGSAPAAAGPINCGYTALSSAVRTVFKALVGPQEPSNEGWFRPLKIVVPDGTVFSANKPSPTGWYYEGSVHASELVWKALANLKKDRFSAGSYTSLSVLYITGKDKNGNLFVHIEPQHGGWGASADADGANALIALTDGDTYNYSIELLEAKFPLRVKKYCLNTEGGAGAGRQRGGFGLIREYEILSDDAEIYCSLSRNTTPPWGVENGREGSCNFVEVENAKNGAVSRLHRVPHWDIKNRDRVRVITGGGGGWGDPKERKTEDVMRDILDDLINPEQAVDQYGVALDNDDAFQTDK
ncbi:hydantoinase B/oxoprolinase family protein [Sneathiella litorea]|uniref:Hydantoinase B/oxoprolinase family protein n=1 Tax=Sneathiella litorea TaxID=2606216 RepID=A0A6L8W412_9PROT|nr:hydantoinase B/oxoprolinase family protein [Sneathiella litorea]MZR29836.1 hydantoinase B/oxoprolinase family protein [Sneathiella litorea]